MGYFVKINTEITKKYELVGEGDFKNLLGFIGSLRFHKISYLGSDVAKEVYYDTPEHLLNKSGVVLSKFEEGTNAFFKVENTAFMSKVLDKIGKEVFIHKIGYNDTLSDHAFYVKDGITALYTTSFSIDLENVLSNAVPKLEIITTAKVYNIASGTGMRVDLALEERRIRNLETKRTNKSKGITIRLKNENRSVFLTEFNNLNTLLLRNCKEFVEIKENPFDYASNVTKAIVHQPKEKKNKEKAKKAK